MTKIVIRVREVAHFSILSSDNLLVCVIVCELNVVCLCAV